MFHIAHDNALELLVSMKKAHQFGIRAVAFNDEGLARVVLGTV